MKLRVKHAKIRSAKNNRSDASDLMYMEKREMKVDKELEKEADAFWHRDEVCYQVEASLRDEAGETYYALSLPPLEVHRLFNEARTAEGKLKVGRTWFLSRRPDDVIDEKKAICMCSYHMEWDNFAEAFLKFLRRTHRQQRGYGGVSIAPCACGCKIPKTKRELKNQLTCPKVKMGSRE